MKRIRLTDIIYMAVLAGVMFVCYNLFYRMSVSYNGKYPSDFTWYINLPTSENKERYRLLGWLFDLMHRNGITIAGQVAYLAAVIAMIMLANYFYLKFFMQFNVDRSVLQIASILIPFIGPIYVPVFHEFYYRWSFQTFAWHSPTQQSMILFSIIAIMCFIKMYESSDEGGVSLRWWILTLFTGLLSAFAKPAFIIDLITAMIIVFLIDLFSQKKDQMLKRLKYLVIMGTSLIPSGIYMLLVMKYDFEGQDDMYSGKILVNLDHVIEYNNLFAAIVCGLAFALLVWIVNYKSIRLKRYKIVFFVFLMGVLQWTLFVEDGIRASHGNFTWGRQVGCYFLTMTSVAIAINNWKDVEGFMPKRPTLRKLYFAALAILLVLHVASQLHFFYSLCKGNSYMC